MEKRQNTFIALLDLLNVKHTKVFSNNFFNEHPHKYNLYGLSKMLAGYGIRNAATRIEDKETDLFNIACPFIAQTGGDFVVVCKVEKESSTSALSTQEAKIGETGKVDFLRNGKKLSIPV